MMPDTSAMFGVWGSSDVDSDCQMLCDAHPALGGHAHAGGGVPAGAPNSDPFLGYSNSPTSQLRSVHGRVSPPSACCDPLLSDGCHSPSHRYGARACLRCHRRAGSPPAPNGPVGHRACSPPPARPMAIYTRGSRSSRGWDGSFGKDALEELREEEEEYEPCELDAETPAKSQASLGVWINGAVDFMAAMSDSFMALSTTDSLDTSSPLPSSSSSSVSALSSPGTPTAARNCASPFVMVPRAQGAGKRTSWEMQTEEEEEEAASTWCGLSTTFSVAKRQRGPLFMPLGV
mmetsp:Transcript_32864/g.82913  ORF Transcript_32864/g.82913 Transcript_32864/m.82913 type:complete len:289 (-) Transcript_32864:279-1145(-)